mmetsp:Transcript_22327/g.42737  ORF Transcript_22327/g.42737 Transcript_22327/m.42737 type:complete len:89 (+) Transcript_22327:249-515(+)|eukprot:CAMPEP_0172765084 /NCGR_PEP_ID=MMETSP1074-20121228/178571_1 /TAXON_ID=2916 /ORGANISM="Ceratium fusus, Strain PA161109" /LENGTH=88 /DNA_ID=CAMNT_0013599967 /DNA_START=225 /DNA_END=491 /DNA_ORIENTATION=+
MSTNAPDTIAVGSKQVAEIHPEVSEQGGAHYILEQKYTDMDGIAFINLDQQHVQGLEHINLIGRNYARPARKDHIKVSPTLWAVCEPD